VAVVAIGIWSVVLSATGTFDLLTDIYVFVLWVFFGMNGAAVIILRKRYPDYQRPYKLPGYPLVPGIFLLVTAYLLLNTLLVTPGRALAGVGLILAGLPIYRYFEQRMESVGPNTWLGDDTR
jgi:APA family basic amino acid/polyamine antiporter